MAGPKINPDSLLGLELNDVSQIFRPNMSFRPKSILFILVNTITNCFQSPILSHQWRAKNIKVFLVMILLKVFLVKVFSLNSF